jgi:hypothetical protein
MISKKCASQYKDLSNNSVKLSPILLLESNYITLNKTRKRDKHLAVAQIVVDNKRKIASLNQKFISTWSLPQDLVMTRCERQIFQFIAEQLKKTQSFLIKIRDVHQQVEEIQDLVELKDGRIFLFIIQPQWVKRRVVGRNYQFLPRYY